MYSFRRLISVFRSSPSDQSTETQAPIPISDDSNEEGDFFSCGSVNEDDLGSRSDDKKRKRIEEDPDKRAPRKIAKIDSSPKKSNRTDTKALSTKKSAQTELITSDLSDNSDLPNFFRTDFVKKYKTLSTESPPTTRATENDINTDEVMKQSESEPPKIFDFLGGSSQQIQDTNDAPVSKIEKEVVIFNKVLNKSKTSSQKEKQANGSNHANESVVQSPTSSPAKFTLDDAPEYISDDDIDLDTIINEKPKPQFKRLLRNSTDGANEPDNSKKNEPVRLSPIERAIKNAKEKKKIIYDIEENGSDDDLIEKKVSPKSIPKKKTINSNNSTPKTPRNNNTNGDNNHKNGSASKKSPSPTNNRNNTNNVNINNTDGNNNTNKEGNEEVGIIDDRMLCETQEKVEIKSYGAFMKQLKGSKSFLLDDVPYKQGDFVMLHAENDEIWICRLEDFWMDENNERKIAVRWFYEPKHLNWDDDDIDEFGKEELVASNHIDINEDSTIAEKCMVYQVEEYKIITRRRDLAEKKGESAKPSCKEFWYRYFYDIQTGEVVDVAKKRHKAIRTKRDKIKSLDSKLLAGSLKERFVAPPQSILDTRQGYWKERNKMWLSLGLNRSKGIKVNKASYTIKADHMRDSAFYHKKSLKEAELGKKLTTNEFKEKYWQREINYADVSVFDPTLTEISYRWFCPPGGRVLDPFAGSIRGVVASCLGLDYTGIELRKDQITQNKYQLERIKTKIPATWIEGDSRNIVELVSSQYNYDPKDVKEEEKFDFIFSCPPFYDLEVYSDDPYDLSVLPTYAEFIEDYRGIIKQTVSLLKENRFAAFVVGDFRDRNGIGQSRPFVADTINAFEDAGMFYYNELILVNSMGSKRFVVQKMYNASKKIARVHQNVLIFVKGDPKMAYTLQDSEYFVDDIIKNNIDQILPEEQIETVDD